ncbi:hypothetical protein [Aneurinibacillus tyrosinisolvens]|uniref:hypothetical protein n=1 Tax=Aneurinibacillus tyrosinisolvens TaxID=1443435 RepID=UPI00063F9D57|nr:hypothetical protein [Aneurinibacillus tyrosinisolvens]
MKIEGVWHISEMEMWDQDYVNIEVRAHITIRAGLTDHFQFGLVQGQMDGKIVEYSNGGKYEFTWEGTDEGDYLHGTGWLRMKHEDIVEGEFKIHFGDNSTFLAKRAE